MYGTVLTIFAICNKVEGKKYENIWIVDRETHFITPYIIKPNMVVETGKTIEGHHIQYVLLL